VTAGRSEFVAATSVALGAATPPGLPTVFDDTPVPTWRRRAEMMASVMGRVRKEGNLR
jgi:hypothetical protein